MQYCYYAVADENIEKAAKDFLAKKSDAEGLYEAQGPDETYKAAADAMKNSYDRLLTLIGLNPLTPLSRTQRRRLIRIELLDGKAVLTIPEDMLGSRIKISGLLAMTQDAFEDVRKAASEKMKQAIPAPPAA